MRVLRTCFLFLVFIFASSQAQAVEITRRPDLAPRLSELRELYPRGPYSRGEVYRNDVAIFEISGVIEKGDAEKVKAAIGDTWGKVIVFNSPGGSFLEGMEIGGYLGSNLLSQDPDLYGVFVLKGDRCLSACALAFTLAASAQGVLDGADSRYVEVGGLLGYHMAFLPGDQAKQLVEVQSAMNLGYDVTQAYLNLVADGATPPALLMEALSHRTADSFFYLSGGIRTYQMGMTPVASGPLAAPINKSALYLETLNAMCLNLFMANHTIQKSHADLEFGFIWGFGPEATETRVEDMFEMLGSKRMAANHNGAGYCKAELKDDGTIGIQVLPGILPCGPKTFSSDAPDWCAISADDATGMPAATNALLAAVKGCHEGRLTRRYDYLGADTSSLDDEELSTIERTLARDVNIRQSPSLDAATLGGLQAGDKVRVVDCGVVSDSQGVWYELASGGWISARFTSELNYESRPASEGP